MKLKFAHRLALYIGAVVTLSLGAVAILLGLLNNQLVLSEEGKSFFSLARLGVLASGLFLVAFSFFCLSLPGRMKQDKADYVVQKTSTGEMRISVQAIESIVQKSLSQYEEIKLQQLQARHTRAGIEIELKASIANNINMPLAVNAVSQHIRRQLKNTVGIEAKEVRVVIDKTDLAAKDSPYKATDATMSLSMDKPNDHSRVGPVPGTQTKEGQHGKI